MTGKCVHTEHCCSRHDCKYGDDFCPVVIGIKTQSYRCEMCGEMSDNNEALVAKLRSYIPNGDGHYNEFSRTLQAAIEALSAAGSQSVPEGWKLVPKDPTIAMVRAASEADLRIARQTAQYFQPRYSATHAEAYDAMLAAAPSSAEEKQG